MATAALRSAVFAALEAKSDTERWAAFDAKARREEPAYEAAALRLFATERDAVVARLIDNVPSPDAPPTIVYPYLEAALLLIAAAYAAGGQYRQAWLARFRPLLRRSLNLGGRSIGVSFNLQNPAAQHAIRQRALKLAGNVSETTLQRVRDVLTEGRQQGLGVTEIARRIRNDAFAGSITRARAQTIARTETVGALNEGAHLAATQNGVLRAKRWLSQRDARVRPDHAAEDNGVWVPISAAFPTTGLEYPHQPGAPPEQVINCRCTLLYSDLPPNEANGASP